MTPSPDKCEQLLDLIADMIDQDDPPCTIGFGTPIVQLNSVTLVATGQEGVEFEYSSNGTSWQDGATFTNQPCGSNRYWIRVKGFSACLASGYAYVNYNCQCIQPSYTQATPVQATCNGNTPNNNASIGITGIQNGNRYGYSLGSSYTGPGYSGAVPFSGGSINLSNLAGSSGSTVYSIRIFNQTPDCYITFQVTVPGINCVTEPVCTPPTVTSATGVQATCTGQTLNNDAQINITGVSGANRWGYSQGGSYSGSPYSGANQVSAASFSITGLPGNQADTTYTVRFFNQSDNCYIDRVVVVPGRSCNVDPGCTTPNFGLVGQPPSCSGGVPTASGRVRLFGVANGNRYGISVGQVYTGPAYSAATPITDLVGPVTILDNIALAPSEERRYYTVRVFNNSNNCYYDDTVYIDNNCIPTCTTPTNGNITVTAATCTMGSPNNNGSVAVPGIGNANRYGISVGSTYNGPSYASATNISGGSISINTLTGSNNNTNYVLRLFNQADACFKDIPFVLPGVNCGCVNPTYSNYTLTPDECEEGALNDEGSVQVTGIQNANKYMLFMYTPLPNQYDSAHNISGNSFTQSVIYSTDEDTPYVLRLYNGSDACYTDIPFTAEQVHCDGPSCGMEISSLRMNNEAPDEPSDCGMMMVAVRMNNDYTPPIPPPDTGDEGPLKTSVYITG